MSFFASKNESLLQSFVDTLFKGVVNGILIAGMAIFVTAWVEGSIERSQQRAALRTFKNDYIVKSVEFLVTSYTNLSCARDSLSVATPECKTAISPLVAGIHERKNFLTALFPGKDFGAVGEVALALNDLQALAPLSSADPQAIQKLTDQFTIAVNQIAASIE